MFKKARESTKQYHTHLYATTSLFKKGTWLEKPEQDIIDLSRKFLDKKDIHILDIGSGIGRNAIALAQTLKDNNVKIECIDYLDIAIQKLLENAKQYHVKDCIKGIVSAVEDFQIKKNTYDLILSHGVLAHVKDKKTLLRVLNDIKDGVKQEGHMYLAIGSDMQEYEVKTKKKKSALVEVYLKSDELVKLYKVIFKNWKIQVIRKDPYVEYYQQNRVDIEWKCVFTVVIAQKI